MGGWRCTPRVWTLADRKSWCPNVPRVTSSSKCPSGTDSVKVVVGRFKDNTKINSKRNFGKIKGKLCGSTGYATGRTGEAYDSFVLDNPHLDKYDAGAGVTEDSELRKLRQKKVVKIWGYAEGAMCSYFRPRLAVKVVNTVVSTSTRSRNGQDSTYSTQPRCTPTTLRRRGGNLYNGKSIDPQRRHSTYGKCSVNNNVCHRTPNFESKVYESGWPGWTRKGQNTISLKLTDCDHGDEAKTTWTTNSGCWNQRKEYTAQRVIRRQYRMWRWGYRRVRRWWTHWHAHGHAWHWWRWRWRCYWHWGWHWHWHWWRWRWWGWSWWWWGLHWHRWHWHCGWQWYLHRWWWTHWHRHRHSYWTYQWYWYSVLITEYGYVWKGVWVGEESRMSLARIRLTLCTKDAKCPAGKRRVSETDYSCTKCEAGRYRENHACCEDNSCTSGEHCDEFNCALCPAGKTEGGNSDRKSEASCSEDCKPGYYCPAGSASSTKKCDNGFYCPSGTGA